MVLPGNHRLVISLAQLLDAQASEAHYPRSGLIQSAHFMRTLGICLELAPAMQTLPGRSCGPRQGLSPLRRSITFERATPSVSLTAFTLVSASSGECDSKGGFFARVRS